MSGPLKSNLPDQLGFSMKANFIFIRKRSFTLLEVLIAFLLIVIAVIPLMAPYPYIFKAQKVFIYDLEMDRLSALYYVDFIARIYKKEIDPSQFKEEELWPIEDKLPIPYKGTYGVSSDKVRVIFTPLEEGEPTFFTWVIPKVES